MAFKILLVCIILSMASSVESQYYYDVNIMAQNSAPHRLMRTIRSNLATLNKRKILTAFRDEPPDPRALCGHHHTRVTRFVLQDYKTGFRACALVQILCF